MVDAPPEVPGHTLERPLGRTGLLYAARSPEGDEETVEVTDPALRPSVVVRALAAREEAAQQRVTSEHLLRLREVITLDDDALALVRDPAGGGSLEDLVQQRGPLARGEVTTVLTPLATMLAELDAAGVVHGALHPGRVLITQQGKPVVTGFDAVRLIGEQHRHPRGEPSGFDAPEIGLGSLPTPASDAWSLGALGWFCLTGQVPPPDAAARADEVLGPDFGAALAPLLEPDPSRRTRARISAGRIYRAAPALPLELVPVPAPPVVPSSSPEAVIADPPEAEPVPVAGDEPVNDPWGDHLVVRPAWGELPGAREATLEHAPPLRRREAAQGPDPAAPPPTGRHAALPTEGLPRRAVSVTTWWRGAVLVLAIVLFVGGFVFVLARRPPAGEASVPATPSSGTPGVVGADPTAQGSATPTELLQGLVDARAAAVSTRDAAALDRAEVPDSPPSASDSALITRLVEASQSYEGLRFRVRDVVVRSRSDTRMELAAVVARDGYSLVGDQGSRAAQPGVTGETYRYQLTRTASGWRLSALTAESPAPAASTG